MKGKFASCKGVAAIEAAIVLLLFLVPLFMGIIDASLAIYNAQVITNASREGARKGIKAPVGEFVESGTEAKIKKCVKDYCLGRLFTWGSEVSADDIIVSCPAPGSDNLLDVTVAFDYSPLFFILPEINLQQNTLMKMEDF